MPEYARVPLPLCDGTAGPSAIADGVEEWTTSKPMRDLLAAFGGALPESGTGANLAYIEAFSAEHWDFRAGRERYETDAKRLDPPGERLVVDAAAALGLAGRTEPPRDHYTHVLVLGGLVGSCLSRTAFAAELIGEGLGAEHVTGVGGFRPLTEAEERAAALSGFDGGRFEVDAMEEGLKRAFEIEGEPETEQSGDPGSDPGRAWKIATYESGARTVRAVAAPSSAPDARRADTVDTCRFWADRVAGLEPGDSVLVVTSAPFVPFQHCDAVAHMGLPYGTAIDTIGAGAAAPGRERLREEYTSSGYLQEVRSAIRSMRRLYDAASASTRERE